MKTLLEDTETEKSSMLLESTMTTRHDLNELILLINIFRINITTLEIIIMGAIRSSPENHINIASEQEKLFECVSASTCGWQQFMEDYLVTFDCHNTHFLIVLDGMGGPEIAEFCRDNLPSLISKNELIQLGQIESGL